MGARFATAEKLNHVEAPRPESPSSSTRDTSHQAFRYPRLPIASLDIVVALLLALFGVAVNWLGASSLEYFRHTEADRTLIGLEMFRSGNWLVPHLLGSEILTKPPVFYWLIATSIAIFGSFDEWVARFPSVFFSGLYIAAVYLFTRRAGAERDFSLVAAFCLGTSLLFSQLATVAEIDLVFGFFSFLSFGFLYFSIREHSRAYTLLAYLAAAAAFLTKGPQVVAFFALAFICYCAWLFWYESRATEGGLRKRALSVVGFHIVGVLFFCSLVGLWVWALAHRVGFELLEYTFRTEVLERVATESSRGRGVLYYVGSFMSGMSPWAAFMVLGLALPLTRYGRAKYRNFESQVNYTDFLIFNLCVFVPAFLLLSFAEGKSSRYIFPIYGNAAILAAFGLWQIRNSFLERLGFLAGKYVFSIAAVVVLVAPFVATVTGVSMGNALLAAAVVAVCSALLASSCASRSRKAVFISAILMMCSIRVGHVLVYVAHRNETRSVKDVAMQIHKSVSPERDFYTVEMFERWVVYYLIKENRRVYRLSPESRLRLQLEDYQGNVLLLVNGDWEYAFLDRVVATGHKFEIVGEYDIHRAPLYLVEVPVKALEMLPLSDYFPTEYTAKRPRQ